MTTSDRARRLEEQIDAWRNELRRRQPHAVVTELEERLREHIAALTNAGLADDEAFLVAARRVSEPYVAHEHAERRRQPVAAQDSATTDGVVAFCLAATAALAVKLPALFGLHLDTDAGFYARNMALFVLPLLAGYFAWKRQLPARTTAMLAAGFVAAAVVVNAWPFTPGGDTEVLATLHLPIALWLAIGIAHAGGRWHETGARMDFVRFSGELFIHYVLIALGGGVLAGLMAMIFHAIGVDVEPFFEAWLLPCALGGVIVAAWLVEARQGVIESIAPMLTRLFTPFLAAVLLAFLGTLLWTGRGVDIERDALIAFDLLLVVVLGLLLYSVSARDSHAPPGLFDAVQVVLLVSALLADTIALWGIGARIAAFGFSPNRVAALGENVILLVNLAWSAVLYVRFMTGHAPFAALERWQTNYIPVYAIWAATVVVVFPPLFGYL